MKAAVLEPSGKQLVIHDDVEIIAPRMGEVRVAVHYCGLCRSDLTVIENEGWVTDPMIVGHEASGKVEAVGPGVTHLKPGDRVVLSPVPPCGLCYFCVRSEHSLCLNSNSILTGTLADGETGLSRAGQKVMRGLGVGAFAERVLIPARGAVRIPDELPLDTACVIGCALQTGVGAVFYTAEVGIGATVLVTGLGGVGIAAVQGARIRGARVIIGSDPVAARRQVALDFGATHVLDPQAVDLREQCLTLTDQVGVDYCVECAGRSELMEAGLEALRPGGTLVCVGAPALEESIHIPSAAMFVASSKILKGCLLGSSNSPRDIPLLADMACQGTLDISSMITHRRPLEEINEAVEDMKAGRGIRTVLELCPED